MLTVEVPLNTMLADLDETLRGMLKEQLERHGFEGIEIAFDAPTREWSGQLSAPAVNLFLYDMRESEERPPVRLDAAARRRRVGRGAAAARDGGLLRDHRLGAGRRGRAPPALAGARGALRLPRTCPRTCSTAGCETARSRCRSRRKVGQAKGDKADFWTAVGGQYKASLDYVVRLSVSPA